MERTIGRMGSEYTRLHLDPEPAVSGRPDAG